MNWRARGVEVTDSICGTHVAEIHDEEGRGLTAGTVRTMLPLRLATLIL
jgi:hypothetical protein